MARVDTVTSGCEWVKPIYLSEPSITALRTAQANNPTVRDDRLAIANHNQAWTNICGNH